MFASILDQATAELESVRATYQRHESQWEQSWC